MARSKKETRINTLLKIKNIKKTFTIGQIVRFKNYKRKPIPQKILYHFYELLDWGYF